MRIFKEWVYLWWIADLHTEEKVCVFLRVCELLVSMAACGPRAVHPNAYVVCSNVTSSV